MDTRTHDLPPLLRRLLRRELLRLARAEEEAAADLAVTVRYWEPYPATVTGHRECAVVLRHVADALDPLPRTRPRGAAPGPAQTRA